MRLIDADALKKDFEKVYPLTTNEMGGIVNKRIYDIIDNAPTVAERPQGDLISREALKKYARIVFDKDLGKLRVVDVSDIDNAPTVEPCYQTTSCLDCGNKISDNFCPNCVAKMKGGKE